MTPTQTVSDWMYIVNTKVLYRNLENEFPQCSAWFVFRDVLYYWYSYCELSGERGIKKQAFYYFCKFVLNSKEIFLAQFL